LAPLYGIARDALSQGHEGEIALYHGALDEHGLYLRDELVALAAAHANFAYRPCVLNGKDGNGLLAGEIDAIVMQRHPALAGFRIYLCGDPTLVNAMRRKLFLAGGSLKKIHADAFVMAPS